LLLTTKSFMYFELFVECEVINRQFIYDSVNSILGGLQVTSQSLS
jgi:hypothetical protein